MHPSSGIDEFATTKPTEPVAPPGETAPEWNTLEARRRRTFLFILFAAIYVGYHLVMRWVEYPLFRGDWYYFGGDPPPWYEFLYRWFLTLLPLAAWGAILFLVLTRFSILTHRRVALLIIALGLIFVEGNMRWFQMSQKHVSWNEILVVFDVDARSVLGVDYEEMAWQIAGHCFFLALCAFLAGPEPRSCIPAIWNGPVGRTYVGIFCRWAYRGLIRLRLDAAASSVLRRLDSKPGLACIAVLVMIDPLVIWALDRERQDVLAERTVVRQIADANPLRFQSLDRTWNRVVFAYSPEAQELAAANQAMRNLDSLAIAANDRTLSISKRKVPARAENILILQAESLNADIFSQTELPFLNEFSKKCLRLKRHFAAGNATHYGILGLLHGSPVTFFTGPRSTHRPNPYLDHLKGHGYKTRLIARNVMSHHHLGDYLQNWTEPIAEPSGDMRPGEDFKAVPVIHEELARSGPRLVFSFYHATHYRYRHDNVPRFQKYTPEVPYEFDYSRSGLIEHKDEIVNRYKNCLLQLDEWCSDILEQVDLSKTIVIITADHGEEFFQQGRLGHCSALNIHQTMTPCLVYIPGVEPADVTFVTSHADIMPTIADALGHAKKPDTLGQSLFAPVSFRYAVLSHFDFTKCKLWAVATENRLAVFERDYWDNVEITSLTDWQGKRIAFGWDASWNDHFRIIRRVEEQMRASRD